MIIGLGFMARSGKDTVANFLVDNHGFRAVAFADALKRGVAGIFGLTREQLYGGDKENIDQFWGDTPRNILQLTGTECMRRGYRDDIWVKCVERVITMDQGHWVITDVRFLNEAAAVKRWGGYVVRVDRPIRAGRQQIATKFHSSETSMLGYEGWSHVINNNKGLAHLRDEAGNMVAKLGDLHAKTNTNIGESWEE